MASNRRVVASGAIAGKPPAPAEREPRQRRKKTGEEKKKRGRKPSAAAGEKKPAADAAGVAKKRKRSPPGIGGIAVKGQKPAKKRVMLRGKDACMCHQCQYNYKRFVQCTNCDKKRYWRIVSSAGIHAVGGRIC